MKILNERPSTWTRWAVIPISKKDYKPWFRIDMPPGAHLSTTIYFQTNPPSTRLLIFSKDFPALINLMTSDTRSNSIGNLSLIV